MVEYEHLTSNELAYLEGELAKAVDAATVLNGRSRKLNMHEIMRHHYNIIEDRRAENPECVANGDFTKTVGSELIIYSCLYFLNQYPEDEKEYLKDVRSDLEWIKSSEHGSLDESQAEKLAEINEVIDRVFSDENLPSDEALRLLRFPSIALQTTLPKEDLRREKLEEINMLGTFTMVYGMDQYNAFKKFIADHREPAAPSAGL